MQIYSPHVCSHLQTFLSDLDLENYATGLSLGDVDVHLACEMSENVVSVQTNAGKKSQDLKQILNLLNKPDFRFASLTRLLA